MFEEKLANAYQNTRRHIPDNGILIARRLQAGRSEFDPL
jgi:hypothetical protein